MTVLSWPALKSRGHTHECWVYLPGQSPTFPAAVAWLDGWLCPQFRLEVAVQVVAAIATGGLQVPHDPTIRWNNGAVELVTNPFLDEPDIVRPDQQGRLALGARQWNWALYPSPPPLILQSRRSHVPAAGFERSAS